AFKSTLEVVNEADLLAHVVDGAAVDPDAQIGAVREVLEEIGAGALPELLAFNKADIDPARNAQLVDQHPGSVAISAVTGAGLDDLQAIAGEHDGGCVDLSSGTPCDPPPAAVVAALGSSGAERGYPASIGTAAFREAATGWLARRLHVTIDPTTELGACIGTK